MKRSRTGRSSKKYASARKRLTAGSKSVARRSRNVRTGGYEGLTLKFVDYQRTALALSHLGWIDASPATSGALNSTATGDGPSDRDGRQIFMKSVHLKGHIYTTPVVGAASPFYDQLVRIVVVMDTQANGYAGITASDVFNADDVHAFRNLEPGSRYRILADKTIYCPNPTVAVGNAATYTTGGSIRKFKMNIKFKTPVVVDYINSTAVTSSISKNAISVVAIEANDFTSITYRSRVRFYH